jgi:hypothetical protein
LTAGAMHCSLLGSGARMLSRAADRRPARRARARGLLQSRWVLVLALLFGLASPLRASPREAEAEVESCDEYLENNEAARPFAREQRRTAHHGSTRSRAIDLSLPPLELGSRSLVRDPPRWQLPRRPAPPEDDLRLG